MRLEVGTRIYNHGDMANASHFGTVTEVRTDKWGTNYTIAPDPDGDYPHGPYTIPAALVSPAFLGHGGTRIVTEAAFQEYRAASIKRMQEWMQRTQTKVSHA